MLIAAQGYHKDAAALTFKDKLLRLQKRAQLNERVQTNCLHLSLNFHPNDKLQKEELEKIAAAYMKGIGFGGQPYLVYQHFDAHHTHLHIVTTNIQKDGSRISLHNLGRGLSESTRKRLEVEFNLVKAEAQQKKPYPVQPLKRVVYGKEETKQAIGNVVSVVVQQYAFASLAELNAILNRYGIRAYRGAPGSPMYQSGGLMYSILDEKGRSVGVPIKASALYGKPTLSRLEAYFERGARRKKTLKNEVVEQLRPHFQNRGGSISQLEQALKQQGIDIVYRVNTQGFLYGVTYIDHVRKAVFNGSDLGKAFSAAVLQPRYQHRPDDQQVSGIKPLPPGGLPAKLTEGGSQHPENATVQAGTELLQQLMQPEKTPSFVPYGFRKKRRRRKGNHL